MTTPPQIAIGDLVPLLYRSGWAQFSLSGEVRARTAEARSRSWEERETCEIGPDGRYRVEVTDGEGDRELLTGDAAGSWVPFPSLMVPASGLLPDFELQIVERAEFLGRAVIAIAGSPRLASRQQLARMSGLIDAELGILLRYQLVSRTRTDSVEFTA